MHRIWLAWIGLALAVTPTYPQAPGEVRGSVVDARGGEPLSNVDVQLVGGAGRAATDETGHFRIAAVAPGDYVLNVSTIGYRLIKKPFHLDAGEAKDFEVILSPDTFRQTDSVEVTAGPFDTVRQDSPSALALSGNDAKNLASVLADDPLRSVQSLPGVSSNDDFDARFSLRGVDYSRIGLYLDGILLHMPFHTVEGGVTTGSGTAFNGDMVEELELQPGAYPVRFQDRTGGVLDVHTRDGSRTATSIRATVSPTNAGVMAEGPLDGSHKGSWLVGARKGFIQYILDRMSTMPSLAFDMADAQGRLAYDLTPHNSFSLYVLESTSGLDRSQSQSSLGINSVMEAGYDFTFGNLAWRSTPASTLLIVNHAAWMREKFDNTNPSNQPLAGGHYGEWVGDSSATWMWSQATPLDIGCSVRRLHDSGFSNQLLSTTPFVRLLDHYDGTALHEGCYAQQSWTLANGHVRLSAGVRGDHHSLMDRSVVLPQASAAVILTPSTRLQLGWGQYAQFPELSVLTSPLGSVHLLPQRSMQAIAALERRLGERARMRLEYYEREDRDLLYQPFYDPRMLLNGKVFIPPANPPWRNSSRAYGRGFEFLLERHSANRLTGWASYAYGVSRQRDGWEGTAFPSDYDQRHTINLFAGYRIRPTVNLSVKWVYGSNFPYPGFFRMQNGVYYLAYSANQLRFNPYQRLDWRINKSWTKNKSKITLYGEVVNLTNHANYCFDSFNSYNTKTGLVSITIDKMFPILPSAGVVFER
ncbi:MAG: TonB-dependent receptor [Bryobacteraceae bacterium]